MRAPAPSSADRRASSSPAGWPNFEAGPPVRTFAWWPAPQPGSRRTANPRPRSKLPAASARCGPSTVSSAPSAAARPYSSTAQKLGVNSSGAAEPSAARAASTSSMDTHSMPYPSAASVSRMAGWGLAFIE